MTASCFVSCASAAAAKRRAALGPAARSLGARRLRTRAMVRTSRAERTAEAQAQHKRRPPRPPRQGTYSPQ
eukprot:2007786-Prorocentrum_lima.AAC.1